MDISTIGAPGAEVFSPVQSRDNERTEPPATESDREPTPTPLPPTAGTVVDTRA
jgi:hypothetical protein